MKIVCIVLVFGVDNGITSITNKCLTRIPGIAVMSAALVFTPVSSVRISMP